MTLMIIGALLFQIFEKLALPDNYQMEITVDLIITNLKILMLIVATFYVLVYYRFDSQRTRLDLTKAHVLTMMWFLCHLIQNRLHDMEVENFILIDA